MRIFIYKVSRLTWGLLMAAIIVSGILVTAAQLASPYLASFKDEIEIQLGSMIGSRIEIGQIKARWKGLGPRLELTDISISERLSGDGNLFLQKIDVDLDMLGMFDNGFPTPGSLTIHGIQLNIERNKDGKIQFRGFAHSDTDEDSTASFDHTPLLRIPNLSLTDTRISWQDATGKTPSLKFENINLRLRNDRDRHQFDLNLSLPGTQNQLLVVKADIRSQNIDTSDFNGTIYLKTENLRTALWSDHLHLNLPDNNRLAWKNGVVSSNIWLSLADGKITRLNGDVAVDNIRLAVNEQYIDIDRLSGLPLWTKKHDGWQLSLQQLNITTANNLFTDGSFSLLHADNATTLSLNKLDSALLDDFKPLASALNTTLAPMQISGWIRDLYARKMADNGRWYSQMTLDRLSILPLATDQSKDAIGLPGAENISAFVRASESGGQILLAAKDAAYVHPGLFREPIPLNSLSGQLNWQQNSDSVWQLTSQQLDAVTPHLKSATRLKIDLPQSGPVIDLQTDFFDADGSYASLYYPAGILSDELLHWLDTSIISGHVTSGSFVLFGPANDFAYQSSHNGHFEILFNAENVILDYQPGWPRLEEVDAQVRFHNNDLEIKAYNGKILDSEIIGATAKVNSLDPTGPLRIKGKTRGPANDIMRLLGETPLQEDFKALTDNVEIDGRSKVELSLEIPMETTVDYKLDGYVTFQENNLSLPEWNLKPKKLKGRLHFDLDGVDAKNLSTQLFGSKTNINISHDKNSITTFDATSRLTIDQIKQFTGDIPESIATGRGDWKVKLEMPPINRKNSGPVKLQIDSTLAGISINAPAPFYKKPADLQNLRIRTELKPDGPLPLDISLGNDISADLKLDLSKPDAPAVTAAHLHFGNEQAVAKDNRLHLNGSLQSINIDDWLTWLQTLPAAKGQPAIPLTIDLHSNQLTLQKREFLNFHISGTTKNNVLSGEVRSDRFSGNYQVVGQNPVQSLTVKLDKANFRLLLDELEIQNNQQDKSELNPGDYPDLHISIYDFSLNDYPFGNLLFSTTRGNKSMRLNELRINGKNLQADATGLWLATDTSQKSMLEFNMTSNDFGEMLTQLGYTPQIAEGDAHFNGNLWWPGSPVDFSQEVLFGKLNMEIREGRLLEFNPGVGRILGFLNLAALQRRLTLDFSDLFKEGFTFDEIIATFNMDNGDAYTNNLFILSPSGKINVSGRTGLKTRDFDQLVTITPSLQSTLTIAGAIAGGPAGAAVAYLAQKLIGSEVDKIARVRYTITGDWVDPVITEIESVNLN